MPSSSGTFAPRRCDVAIVGAGPAGAAAALRLARGGRSVILLEKEALPRYKTCGGGVVARAFRHLPSDVRIPVEHECFRAEAWFLDSGSTVRVERPVPIVTMTMRADLDKSLTDAAVASGVDLLAPCELLDLRQDPDGVDLETSRGSIRASFVVGADGALSSVARKAGWSVALRTMPALEAEVRVPPEIRRRFSGVARFDFGGIESGYGWVFPKREHLSCGVLTTRRGAGGLHRALDAYLARCGVTDVLAKESRGYLIPVEPRRGGLAKGRTLLVGDAAGLADALTGEGISIALHSGSLAASALLDARLDPGATRRLYLGALRSEILGDLRIARMLARIVYRRPSLARHLLRWRGQALAEGIAEVFLGNTSYRALVLRPRAYLRLLRTPRPVPAPAR